jgi:hypothetical protein
MALDWQSVVAGMTPVQKMVHLAMREDQVDEDRIRSELLKSGRRAFESELTIQAARVGCPGRSGQLRNGPILSELNEIYAEHAKSIVNTYNWDLAGQILEIAFDVPRANRHTYSARLQRWDRIRGQFKGDQIGQMTEAVARSLAQQHFYQQNGAMGGTARLEPTAAVCPVCIGWVARGEVPLNVALSHPPPYHNSCPHAWVVSAGKRTEEECKLLWMGGD